MAGSPESWATLPQAQRRREPMARPNAIPATCATACSASRRRSAHLRSPSPCSGTPGWPPTRRIAGYGGLCARCVRICAEGHTPEGAWNGGLRAACRASQCPSHLQTMHTCERLFMRLGGPCFCGKRISSRPTDRDDSSGRVRDTNPDTRRPSAGLARRTLPRPRQRTQPDCSPHRRPTRTLARSRSETVDR